MQESREEAQIISRAEWVEKYRALDYDFPDYFGAYDAQ